MTRNRLARLVALAAAVITCRPTSDVVAPVPEPVIEPAVESQDGGAALIGDAHAEAGQPADRCSLACATFRRLRCEEGGDSCEPVCRRVEAARLTDLHLACVGAARTIFDVRRCDPRNCKVTQ